MVIMKADMVAYGGLYGRRETDIIAMEGDFVTWKENMRHSKQVYVFHERRIYLVKGGFVLGVLCHEGRVCLPWKGILLVIRGDHVP